MSIREKTEQLVELLKQKQMLVATAESCSGGLLAAAFTDLPGVSKVYDRGLVTYSNEAKMALLHVKEETLAAYGAVSEQTAHEMAEGLLQAGRADLVLVTTGIAGPDGGSVEKPVGLVYVGAGDARHIVVEKNIFPGDRAEVRRQTVEKALDMALQLMNGAV